MSQLSFSKNDPKCIKSPQNTFLNLNSAKNSANPKISRANFVLVDILKKMEKKNRKQFGGRRGRGGPGRPPPRGRYGPPQKRPAPEDVEVVKEAQTELQVPPKKPRIKIPSKKSRVIVRNLSFQVTEEKIRQYFSKCGQITEVALLRKPDGKLVGCGFIQFDQVYEAIKAIKELNMKKFMGRPIAIDWAIPKEKYRQSGVKSGGEEEEKKPKVEEDTKEEVKTEVDEEEESEEDDEDDEEESEEDDDEEEESGSESDTEKKVKKEVSKKGKDSEEKKINENDAEEGKTLFVRNLSFEVDDKNFGEFFKKFGPIYYAVICRNKLTEYSKGVGFVKFVNIEDAQTVLEKFEREPSSFTLENRNFNITIAYTREKLSKTVRGRNDQNKSKK